MITRAVLNNRTETTIRFSEIDSMSVVWHGNYVKYLEDGREAFGRQYKLGYLDVYHNQVMTPVVELTINYKNYVKYGDEIIIETEFEDTPAAKIIFNYRIIRKSDGVLISVARTVQVFVDLQGNLLLTIPAFYSEWKAQLGL